MAGISEVLPITTGNSYKGISPCGLQIKTSIDKKFKIPKEFLNEYITENDGKEKLTRKSKSYSNENLNVTEDDIIQYNEWVDDKTKQPQLINKFDSIDDYINFMTNYKDSHLTLNLDPAVMKNNKTFSLTNEEAYEFKIDTDSWQGDEQWLDFDHVIGSLLFSVTFAHLFHLCTTDYAAHIALNDYYEEMPEKADALAEKFLADNSMAVFANAILPGLNPVDYFERLKKFIVTFEGNMGGVYPDESAYASELDDVINLISSTLYKLKRLAINKKSFSTKK